MRVPLSSLVPLGILPDDDNLADLRLELEVDMQDGGLGETCGQAENWAKSTRSMAEMVKLLEVKMA